ncbi:hypothetical protein OAO72_00235 [Alphaproteobacteria bacterium]|nr:hypothetical protein [Alphaproteobacteria bacterium]
MRIDKRLLVWGSLLLFFFTVAVITNPLVSWSRYLMMPESIGNRDFMNKLLIDTPSKRIDVLIIGASVSWSSVSAIEIQNRLRKELGTDVTVLNLSSNWRGENLYHELLKRVLEKHNVGIVLFDPPNFPQATGRPHPLSLYFQSEFPLEGNITASNLIDVARYQLIDLLRLVPKLQETYINYSVPDSPALSNTNGSLQVDRWMTDGEYNSDNLEVSKFLLDGGEILKQQPIISYLDKPVHSHDRRYFEAIVDLVQQYSTLSLLHVPMLEDADQQSIQLSSYFQKFIVGKKIPIFGLSGSDLTKGKGLKSKMLYYDNIHMNSLGAKIMGAAIGAQLSVHLKTKNKN